MTKKNFNHTFSRRDFLKLAGGGLVAAAGASMLPATFNKMLQPSGIASAAAGDPNLYLAGTDAWISVRETYRSTILIPWRRIPTPLTCSASAT